MSQHNSQRNFVFLLIPALLLSHPFSHKDIKHVRLSSEYTAAISLIILHSLVICWRDSSHLSQSEELHDESISIQQYYSFIYNNRFFF